jgi:hypothetical protein
MSIDQGVSNDAAKSNAPSDAKPESQDNKNDANKPAEQAAQK